MKFRNIVFLLLGSLLLLTCGSPTEQTKSSGKLKIVATTTLVGDIVSQVGGDLIELNVLLPVGADPHSFDPTPQDIAKVADSGYSFRQRSRAGRFP